MTLIFRYIIKKWNVWRKIHICLYIHTNWKISGYWKRNFAKLIHSNECKWYYKCICNKRTMTNILLYTMYNSYTKYYIYFSFHYYYFSIIIWRKKKIVRSHFKTIQFYELKSNGNKIKIHVVLLHVRVKEIESNLE